MNKSNSCYINGKIKSKISRRIFPKTHKKVQLITDGTLKYQIYCCSDSAKKKKTKLNSYVYLKNEKKMYHSRTATMKLPMILLIISKKTRNKLRKNENNIRLKLGYHGCFHWKARKLHFSVCARIVYFVQPCSTLFYCVCESHVKYVIFFFKACLQFYL